MNQERPPRGLYDRKPLSVILIIMGFSVILYFTIGPPATTFSPLMVQLRIPVLAVGFLLAVGGALLLWGGFR